MMGRDAYRAKIRVEVNPAVGNILEMKSTIG